MTKHPHSDITNTNFGMSARSSGSPADASQTHWNQADYRAMRNSNNGSTPDATIDQIRRRPDEIKNVGLNGTLERWNHADGSSESRCTTDKYITMWRDGTDGKTLQVITVIKDIQGEQFAQIRRSDGSSELVIGSTGYCEHAPNTRITQLRDGTVLPAEKIEKGIADKTIREYRRYVTR